MAENQPGETVVRAVRAAYADGRSSKDVEYFLSYTWNADGRMQPALFKIDRRLGIVKTRKPIDRERGAAKYVVDLYAVDLASSIPLSIKTQMNVYILDR